MPTYNENIAENTEKLLMENRLMNLGAQGKGNSDLLIDVYEKDKNSYRFRK